MKETLPFQREISFERRQTEPVVQPFAMADVRLLPGTFKDAEESNRAYLNRLPADRLLHTFRLNAGLPSSAEPLGGWEKPDCELRGHFVGHFLSACALMYSATGDQEIKRKATTLWANSPSARSKLGGGYLSAFPLELFRPSECAQESLGAVLYRP